MANYPDTTPPPEITIEHKRGAHFATYHATGAVLAGSTNGDHFLTFYMDVPEVKSEKIPQMKDAPAGTYDGKAAVLDVAAVREEQCRVVVSAATLDSLIEILGNRPGKVTT